MVENLIMGFVMQIRPSCGLLKTLFLVRFILKKWIIQLSSGSLIILFLKNILFRVISPWRALSKNTNSKGVHPF